MPTEKQLGTAPMLPLILKMAIPNVIAQVINLLYSIIDRIFIGRIPDIGTDALAGVGVTGSIIILITSFSAIVGMGGAPLAAIALGKNDRDRAKYILGNGTTLLILFSAILSTLVYAFMEPILLFTGASQSTLPFAVDYLSIYLSGTIFVMITVGLNTFITIQGHPTIAMFSVLIGAVTNIILDYVFIFEMHLGVKGAAYATIISQAFSSGWVLHFLLSKKATLPLQKRFLIPHKGIILSILALGISPFVMSSTEALVGFVLNGNLKSYGDVYISAMAIIQSAALISSIPLTGFSQGFMPIIGYNFGAGKSDRVKQCFKISFTIITIFNFMVILFIIFLPDRIASAFTNDLELIKTVEKVAPTFFFGMLIFGMQRTCQGMFIALGEAKISIFIALLRKIILLIPLAFILPTKLGLMGIYWAESISDATAAIICISIFLYLFPKIIRKMELSKSLTDPNCDL